jgi:saccharopine dehydrogenase (NAD+, L-lysine-forming)
MKKIKIGLIKEGKVPTDRRVALTPEQCRQVMELYPHTSICVEPSTERCYSNEEYRQAGIPVTESLEDCSLLFGIKEVPPAQLIPDKTYLFFSHTIKEQPFNRQMLQAILQKNITLIDYECLTNTSGERVVAFGRYAGIVGAYNGIMTYGRRHEAFELAPAHQCLDLQEIRKEFSKVKLPAVKIAVTGRGRVGKGVAEVLLGMQIQQVTPQQFLEQEFNEPVFTQLGSADYYQRLDGEEWNSEYFYDNPDKVASTFRRYTKVADILLAAAYWDPKSPTLFSAEDMKAPDFRIKVIADITCDIKGSIPSTLRASTIQDPVYDYNPYSGELEPPFSADTNINVMAVDNLPCELPRDASKDFGKQLIEQVFPFLLGDKQKSMLAEATIAKAGELTGYYSYLSNYVYQK